jgi:hypothetical protein
MKYMVSIKFIRFVFMCHLAKDYETKIVYTFMLFGAKLTLFRIEPTEGGSYQKSYGGEDTTQTSESYLRAMTVTKRSGG